MGLLASIALAYSKPLDLHFRDVTYREQQQQQPQPNHPWCHEASLRPHEPLQCPSFFKQVVNYLGKGAECLPDSWRHNPDSLRGIQKHRKKLVAEIAADNQKVVCPWRPGGRHIAHEPWQAFVPRDRRPPVRSASEEKASTLAGENEDATVKKHEKRWRTHGSGGVGGGEGGGEGGGRERPHTAPSRRRKPFIDIISPRARRVLAAQSPDMPLHNVFSAYSNEPFPRFEPALGPTRPSGQARRSPGPFTDTRPHNVPGDPCRGRHQRVWSAMICPSSSCDRPFTRGNTMRPHSAAPQPQRKFRAPPQRPSTASGATNATESLDGIGGRPSPDFAHERGQECSTSSQSLNLNVRSGLGVTVLWARLCTPSSDLAYEGSNWPSRPTKSSPSHLSRRRDKPSPKGATETAVAERENNPAQWGDVGEAASAVRVCSTPVVDSECENGRDARRLSGGATLVDLEERLLASTWNRINQRHTVFRFVGSS